MKAMTSFILFCMLSAGMFFTAGWLSDYELWHPRWIPVIILYSCFVGWLCTIALTQERR